METLLTILHVVFCVFLILVILLQTGKGGGMGTAFGGSSQSVFGPRGAGSFIGKLTGIVAALFMLTSLSLAYVSSTGKSGIDEKVNAANEMSAGDAEEVDLTAPEAPVEESEEVSTGTAASPTTTDTAATDVPSAETPAAGEAKEAVPNNPAAPAPPNPSPAVPQSSPSSE